MDSTHSSKSVIQRDERRERKILFVGPVGAGKTTAVKTISDHHCVSTDVQASDMTLNRKQTTTAAMDYSVHQLKNGERIHIYGAPGQERFRFMWEILSENSCGIVLLLDNSRDNPVQDLKYFLKQFAEFVDKSQLTIGVTHMDLSPNPALSAYRAAMSEQGLFIPIHAVDARSSADVAILISLVTCSDEFWLQDFEPTMIPYQAEAESEPTSAA